MANLGAYLVPTTITYAALQREGVAAGMPTELVEKVGEAVKQVRFRGWCGLGVGRMHVDALMVLIWACRGGWHARRAGGESGRGGEAGAVQGLVRFRGWSDAC
jgi:hypothetical protein